MSGIAEAGAGNFINIAALAVSFAFVITLLLPHKIHAMINGVILFTIGITHILYETFIIEFDVRSSPVLIFVIVFVVAATSKELIAESIREKGKVMKGLTFLAGLILIVLVLVPELYHLGALSFNLPDYPFFINAIIYLFAGAVAIIAPFLAGK
ncbi:hypothetical protein JW707_02660 [Candidatus Woesearchaeota archaeon]|nr:hypothetical protein [Candidatus Woesearchaeota archaeon]